MDTIRVAIIGFGYAGRVFHGPLISAVPGLSVTVIGSRQGDAAQSAYPNAAVVADPLAAVRHGDADLVVIATPDDTHVPLAEAALRAGKHVVVDKPFTLTLAEARALAALAGETGRQLSVFQNRRFDSDFLALKRAIESGQLGDVVEVRSEISRWRPQIRDRWRERGGPGSGIWYDFGPHLADQAMVLFGPPQTVQADLQIQRAGGASHDWFQAVLGYGPRRVILEASMLDSGAWVRFVARGTQGTMMKRRNDVQESQMLAGMAPGAPGWGRDPDAAMLLTEGSPPQELETPPGDHRRYDAAIRDAIRGDGPLPVTPAQATALMAVIEAGFRSAESGRTVIPDFTEAEQTAWQQPSGLSGVQERFQLT